MTVKGLEHPHRYVLEAAQTHVFLLMKKVRVCFCNTTLVARGTIGLSVALVGGGGQGVEAQRVTPRANASVSLYPLMVKH